MRRDGSLFAFYIEGVEAQCYLIASMAPDRHILYMAPMLGITESAYRAAFAEGFGGFDCAITPFIKTLQGGRCKDAKFSDLHPSRNKSLKIFPQILSNDSSDFIAIAQELFDLGYDKININFGCPVPMAAGRGRGAGLLPHPDFVDRFLDEVFTAIPNQISIKTRVGFDCSKQLLAMTKVFNRYPIFEIAIHPRTAKQGYGGEINHDAFVEAIGHLTTSIIYSGDINSLADFVALKERYPHIRKWMLGRGALANPFLPAQIRKYLDDGIFQGERRFEFSDLIGFYHNLNYQFETRNSEPNVALSRLKTLFYYQADYLQSEKQLIRGVRKAKNFDEFLWQLN